MRKFFWQGVVWIILLLTSHSSMAGSVAHSTNKFISIADIHFDPFAGCKISPTPCALLTQLRAANYQNWAVIFAHNAPEQFASTGNDTNYPLFKSTLTALQTVNATEHPSFMVILGDFLAHDFRGKYVAYSHDLSAQGYQAFVKKTLAFMTLQLHQALPELAIYPVVGNNDSYTGDYTVVPQGRFLHDLSQIWGVFVRSAVNKNNLALDFPAGGYYAVTPAQQPKQRVILLNTVLFSSRIKGKPVAQAAQAQLRWLHQQLLAATQQQQHVLIAFHIPLGIDVYASLKSKLSTLVEYWQPQYSKAFIQELNQFPSLVTEILPAHIHLDAFQLITVNRIANIPVNFTPAISPIFGNNPTFKVFSYDTTHFQIKDFATYFYPIHQPAAATWQKEQSFL